MSYTYYQPNPARKSFGDCTVRALSKALGQTWEETYVGLALEGFVREDLPNADSVWGPYLREHGFVRHLIPESQFGAHTVADFARENPRGTYILSMPGRHVVSVVDGVIFDSWDSRNEAPSYYWTMANPLYSALGGKENTQNRPNDGGFAEMVQQFRQYASGFQGDPTQELQKMLSSGQMNQSQYNQLRNVAQRIASMLPQ